MVKEKKERMGNPVLNLIKAEWKYLGSRRKQFIFFMILLIIGASIGNVSPLLIGLIFNQIQLGLENSTALVNVIYLLGTLVLLEVLTWSFWGPGRIIQQRVGFFTHRNYLNTKLRNILALPIKWHKDNHSGKTIDRLNKGGGAINGFSQNTIFQIVDKLVSFSFSVVILFYFDLTAGIMAVVFSSLALFIITRFDKRLYKQYEKLHVFDNKVSAALYDYIGNITTVITLRLRKMVSAEINKRIMDKYELFRKTLLLEEIKWAVATILIEIMVVLVLIMRVVTDFNSGEVILVGTLFILYQYLNNIGRVFYGFAEIYGNITRFDSSLANMAPVDKEFRKIKEDNSCDMPKEWNEVELRDIDFKHNARGKIVHLDNIGMKFKLGDKIALVGESGSGKSTIMGLIRGLNIAKSGKVFVDGNEADHGLARLKKHVTLIPQDPEIFNNTIGYNINMDLPVKKDEMKKVIKMARFEKVVERLPKGLSTNVMEKGVSLSGGEKQRLALARGILAAKESEIVLMDEPTSSVDSVNELAIYEDVLKEFDDKAVISSIHRLHLLNKFDYIYLFDKGKVIAEGTLSEVKKNPIFKRMWKKYKGEK